MDVTEGDLSENREIFLERSRGSGRGRGGGERRENEGFLKLLDLFLQIESAEREIGRGSVFDG